MSNPNRAQVTPGVLTELFAALSVIPLYCLRPSFETRLGRWPSFSNSLVVVISPLGELAGTRNF